MAAKVNSAGKRVRGENRFTIDIRNAIEQAFHKAGGRDYLVRVAKRRPDVFLALVSKILPSEVKMSVLAAYQALPSVPVEIRDPLPGSILAPPVDLPIALPAPAAPDEDDFFRIDSPVGQRIMA